MFLQVEAGRLFAIECWKRLVAASFSMDYTWLYQAHSNSQKDRNKTHHYFGGILLFSCPGACCTYYICWVPPYPYVYMWIYIYIFKMYIYIYISSRGIYIYTHYSGYGGTQQFRVGRGDSSTTLPVPRLLGEHIQRQEKMAPEMRYFTNKQVWHHLFCRDLTWSNWIYIMTIALAWSRVHTSTKHQGW